MLQYRAMQQSIKLSLYRTVLLYELNTCRVKPHLRHEIDESKASYEVKTGTSLSSKQKCDDIFS